MRTHWIFRHMACKGVFVAVQPDRWYLDLEALAAFQRHQWRRFLIFIGVGALGLVVRLLFR